MNKAIRAEKILLIASVLTSSLAYGTPSSNRESAKAYCARTSNSRIMFVDPRPGDTVSTAHFNLIDGQPIR